MNEQDMEKLAGDYAVVAENLLKGQGAQYTEEDVVKVASFLIDNDYPDTNPEQELEQIKVAAFYDELEKQAMQSPNAYAKAFGEWLAGKIGGAAPAAGGMRERVMNFAFAHPKSVGYGTAGLGAAAVGGGGYAGYRAFSKESSFEKEAKNPNQIAEQFGSWLTTKLKGDKGLSKWLKEHSKTVGYGAAATGAAAVGGGGYAGYRAMKKESSFDKEALKSPNAYMRDLAGWGARKVRGGGIDLNLHPHAFEPTKRERLSALIARNPLLAGYGAVGLGTAGVVGAGLGVKKMMSKESSFGKEAMRSPNAVMQEFGAWIARKAAGSAPGPRRQAFASALNNHAMATGYGAAGLGAAGVAGLGYGGYRAYNG